MLVCRGHGPGQLNGKGASVEARTVTVLTVTILYLIEYFKLLRFQALRLCFKSKLV